MKNEVSLSELLSAGLAREIRGDAAVRVSGVQHDSRRVGKGDLFVAIGGHEKDGASFAAAAARAGAAAVAAERSIGVDVPELLVDDARYALSAIAAFVYGDPTARIPVVGVTGTNGKTTVTYLLESILNEAGARPAVMGTVNFRRPGYSEPAPHTTPEGDDIARFARAAVDSGATHMIMEVSSHGLALRRVDGVHFDVAAFTNLTQDHLDLHQTMEAYGSAKARLFRGLAPRASVINVDDPFGADLATSARSRVLRCSQRGAEAEVSVADIQITRQGISARLTIGADQFTLKSPLVGRHNVENLIVAAGSAFALSIDLDSIGRGLACATGAPGRLERVTHPEDVLVFVDYAHTPDALRNVLATLRVLTPGRLFVVFGCGGDRDALKRPLMGQAAAEGADMLIVTSDNPRTEKPEAILDAIVPGVESGGQRRRASLEDAIDGYVVEVDRRAAIGLAIRAARAGDTVLIAGKGHEDYQIIGHERRAFDDRIEARDAIAGLG